MKESIKIVFFRTYIRQKWIDLHQTKTKMITGPFYTYHLRNNQFITLYLIIHINTPTVRHCACIVLCCIHMGPACYRLTLRPLIGPMRIPTLTVTRLAHQQCLSSPKTSLCRDHHFPACVSDVSHGETHQ